METTTLFVGLGRMGGPMVRRHRTVFETLVSDRDPEAATRLAEEEGLRPPVDLADPAGLPDGVGTVVLMLPDSRAVESVLLDEATGLLARLRQGALVIDMGSSEPASTRRLAGLAAERDIGYVDAPVSGGVARAVTGELAIMAGGSDEDVAWARPHLEPLGGSIVHVGPPGAGHAAKALNNLLSATNLAAAAEILCVAQAEGIDPAVMVQVINSSTGRSQATEVKYPQHVLTGTFASGFAMDLMLKDLGIAHRLAEEDGVTTPITATTVATLAEARRVLDRDDLDHTELVQYYEQVNRALLRNPDPETAPSTAPDTAPDSERTDA